MWNCHHHMRWRARLKAVECPERTKRRRYTTSTEIFWSAISLCKLTYLNLYSLALITLTSLFTERNDAECFLLSPLSNTKLDRLQIKDQRGRFHYQAISLLYHTNNLLKLSAIIFSPFRRRHRVLASEMTVILSSCLFVCVNVCACVCAWICAHTSKCVLDCTYPQHEVRNGDSKFPFSTHNTAWLSTSSLSPETAFTHISQVSWSFGLRMPSKRDLITLLRFRHLTEHWA